MFHIFDSIPSTNDYCLEYAKQHPNEHIVCIADHQTQGRGRNGKTWDSTQAQNLYLSYLRPTQQKSPLSLVTGIVIAQLIESLGISGVQLKWPNDVWLNRAKIAGILIEGQVIGIGLNLSLPSVEGATALSEHGCLKLNKMDLARDLIDRLEDAICTLAQDGFKPFTPDWERLDGLAGKLIAWENGRLNGESRALGVNEAGGLILEDEPGVLYAGSVRLLTYPLPYQSK